MHTELSLHGHERACEQTQHVQGRFGKHSTCSPIHARARAQEKEAGKGKPELFYSKGDDALRGKCIYFLRVNPKGIELDSTCTYALLHMRRISSRDRSEDGGE